MDDWALSQRPSQHVPGMKPILCAAVGALLRWPDTELPAKLILGFETLFKIPPSGIFRPIQPKVLPESSFFGADAARYVEELEADTRVSPNAAAVHAQGRGLAVRLPLLSSPCVCALSRRAPPSTSSLGEVEFCDT